MCTEHPTATLAATPDYDLLLHVHVLALHEYNPCYTNIGRASTVAGR